SSRTGPPDRTLRLTRVNIERTINTFIQIIAAPSAMHGAQIDDRGGLLGGVTIDAIVQLQKISIERGKRIGCIDGEWNRQMIRLANVPDIGEVLYGHSQIAEAFLRHQPTAR